MSIKNKIKNIFTPILNIIFQVFLFVFSFTIPKRKNSLLFGAGDGMQFSDNSKYLYLYCLKNTRTEAYWCTRNDMLYKKLKKENLPVLKIGTLKHFWYLLRVEYLFLGMSISDVSYVGFLPGKFNKIQGWHGTPFKKIALDAKIFVKRYSKNKFILWLIKKEFSSYKLIISTSEVISENVKSAFSNNNVIVLGYPRNDILFLSDCNNQEIKKILLKKYKKILLYAPTFRDLSGDCVPFSENFLIRLNNYLESKNYILLIKKHPFEKNLKLPSNTSRILDISNTIDDIQEILVFTDILITDYSSVFFDFILTIRPIIFYPYDYINYIENCRDMYYDYFRELPGPFAKNENDLLHLIQSCKKWFNDANYTKKYNSFKNKFNTYKDGNSSKRIINYIFNKNS